MDHEISADFVMKADTVRSFEADAIDAMEAALLGAGVHPSIASGQARQTFVALDAFRRVYERHARVPVPPLFSYDLASGDTIFVEQPMHEGVIPNTTEPLVPISPTYEDRAAAGEFDPDEPKASDGV